jgi:hypothetical protein
MSFTWPGGVGTSIPSTFDLPAVGELNWFTTINGFLESLGTGAQCTTFQRYAVTEVSTSPFTVSDQSCVLWNNTTGRTLNLPAGSEKLVYYITNNSQTAITTTIAPNGAETIGGYYNSGGPAPATLDLTNPYESVGLIFSSGDWKIFQWSNKP